MKDIIKSLFAGALALVAVPLMTSCENDDDSNPTLRTPDSFVLNTPAYAENNTYDLSNAESVNLTTTQPAYGFPAATVYQVQVSLDENFRSVTTVDVPGDISYRTLEDSYTTANMNVNGVELNNAIVSLYQAANNGADPSGIVMPAYIRLVAHINGTDVGWCASNVITLPKVVVSYIATAPTEVYVAGSSIRGGTEAKQLGVVNSAENNFFGMVYMAAGSSLMWGGADSQANGYALTTTKTDNANAGLSEGADGGIAFANAGWYAILMKFTVDSEANQLLSTLEVYPGEAYVTGAVASYTGDWPTADPAWAMTAPADASGQWESPAFSGSGELRAYIYIPTLNWYQTEFTIYNESLFWRGTYNIGANWAENVGADYSVTCAAGQRLYIDFDYDKGEVR